MIFKTKFNNSRKRKYYNNIFKKSNFIANKNRNL